MNNQELSKSMLDQAYICIDKALDLIEKSKGKTTVAKEKKAGRYIGFKKLVEDIKEKNENEDEVKKSISELNDEDYIDLAKSLLEDEETNIEKAVNNPAALAAWIGRKKYGAKKFQEMAATGRKKAVKK